MRYYFKGYLEREEGKNRDNGRRGSRLSKVSYELPISISLKRDFLPEVTASFLPAHVLGSVTGQTSSS